MPKNNAQAELDFRIGKAEKVDKKRKEEEMKIAMRQYERYMKRCSTPRRGGKK